MAEAMTGRAVLGAAIRDRRTGLGLSRQDVAARAGVAWNTVRNMEAGRHQPRFSSVVQVAGALGLDARALAGLASRGACAPGLGWPLEAPAAVRHG